MPTEEWTYVQGALESSSYMKLGPIMKWFTGSIGYHHVHHLNPHIPFYRLPEAMAAIPELQHPVVTSLRPRDILSCFRESVGTARSWLLTDASALRAASTSASAVVLTCSQGIPCETCTFESLVRLLLNSNKCSLTTGRLRLVHVIRLLLPLGSRADTW